MAIIIRTLMATEQVIFTVNKAISQIIPNDITALSVGKIFKIGRMHVEIK